MASRKIKVNSRRFGVGGMSVKIGKVKNTGVGSNIDSSRKKILA